VGTAAAPFAEPTCERGSGSIIATWDAAHRIFCFDTVALFSMRRWSLLPRLWRVFCPPRHCVLFAAVLCFVDAALCFVAVALAWLFLLPRLWHGCFSPAAVFFGGHGVVFGVFVAVASV